MYLLYDLFRWRGSMVGDGVELVGVSQTGDLVGVELEDEIPGGGNGTLKVLLFWDLVHFLENCYW